MRRVRCTMSGLLAAMVLVAAIAGSVRAAENGAEEKSMTYHVPRAPAGVPFDSEWDGEFWKSVEPLELKHFMGERPEHFPQVRAKLRYDDGAVYVIFRVDDRYVRAVAKEHQDAVWKDSCVEFFFTPHEDVEQGYCNLEMNCGGTLLLHYQRVPREEAQLFSAADLAKIDVRHSLPKIVDPEITKATRWTVAYRLPVEIFRQHFPTHLQPPAPGVTWRANFYKCADDSSHPHWLTWSPVVFERPDFHRPQSFGTLKFQ